MVDSLLPAESTPYERALEASLHERWEAFSIAAESIRGIKYSANRPQSFAPYLVYEYGLDFLRPFVPDLNSLIVEGVAWERVRGTPQAVALGLRWVGYTATIVQPSTDRRWWNSFQLYFGELPRFDAPDLSQIEGVVGLSVPKRSQFRRGVFGYDATALILNSGRLNQSMLDFESGVSYRDSKAIWSFGRLTELTHTLSQAEGEAIGNWLEPVDDDGLLWVDMTYPWVTADFKWADDGKAQRAALMAAFFRDRIVYMQFVDDGSKTIGYRRCKCAPVRATPGGSYEYSGATFAPSASGDAVYIEALTGFGDAQDVRAVKVALVVDAQLAAGVRPGRLWLGSSEIVGGKQFAETAISLDMRKTLRQQVKILLRF